MVSCCCGRRRCCLLDSRLPRNPDCTLHGNIWSTSRQRFGGRWFGRRKHFDSIFTSFLNCLKLQKLILLSFWQDYVLWCTSFGCFFFGTKIGFAFCRFAFCYKKWKALFEGFGLINSWQCCIYTFSWPVRILMCSNSSTKCI